MLFLVGLFLLKTTSIFKNKETYQSVNQENGLTYSSNTTLQDLVNKDTDGDGILDWQESLYGLDPTKKETTPGIPDSIAINKLKTEQESSATTINGNEGSQGTEKLTQTDKFSRELFATMVAANQNGQMDQATTEALSTSLAEKIQNSVPRKIYTISDIKTIDTDTKQAIQKYSDELASIYTKYNDKKGVIDILQEFIADEENVGILSELDPIINQLNKVTSESVKMQVPRSLSLLHLDLINNFQRVLENISDIRLFDSDIVVAISAISQYEKNATALESAMNILLETIKQKLNN